ncbi:MAG TPA: pitrilysin family protein [Candidatus Margulisiibacteriota bacterium]|nr:pitrilysin family protein [Candidatus Margulisiibacteriota bacterium]
MRKHAWVVGVVAWLLGGVPAHAAVSYAERVKETVLPNGLKVLLLEDHKAPVAVFQVWYRVGSRNEQLGKTGLSHLLEHLMFKGTKTVGPEEYSKIIQRNGGNDNAFTAEDATTYFATLASDRVSVVIDLEADRMHNLTFDEAQFTPEHQVVMEERRLRTDNNPVAALFELINSTAYEAHPYGWPIIGFMNDLRQATRDDALTYYRAYYTPVNAFVVCTGDFSSSELMEKISKAFAAVPAGELPPRVRAIEPEQHGERRAVLHREAQLPFVAIGYHVPNLRDKDGAALEVLSAVLAGGESARMHQHLVYEKRLVRDAGASYDLTTIDPSLFTLYAQPLPGKSAAQVEKELLAEVENLQRTAVSEHELTKAKNGLQAHFIFAQDSLFYQALLLGQYESSTSWRDIDTYLPQVLAVRAEDLQRVAGLYLTANNRTVATLDPLPVPPGRRPPAERVPQGTVH